jgi:hypothetical protein
MVHARQACPIRDAPCHRAGHDHLIRSRNTFEDAVFFRDGREEVPLFPAIPSNPMAHSRASCRERSPGKHHGVLNEARRKPLDRLEIGSLKRKVCHS